MIPAILTYPDGQNQLTAVPCDVETADHGEMASDEIELHDVKEDERLVQLRLIQAQRREETH